jgi:hypothetical protein
MRLHPNRGHSVRGASGIASLQLHRSQQQCTQAVGAQNPQRRPGPYAPDDLGGCVGGPGGSLERRGWGSSGHPALQVPEQRTEVRRQEKEPKNRADRARGVTQVPIARPRTLVAEKHNAMPKRAGLQFSRGVVVAREEDGTDPVGNQAGDERCGEQNPEMMTALAANTLLRLGIDVNVVWTISLPYSLVITKTPKAAATI